MAEKFSTMVGQTRCMNEIHFSKGGRKNYFCQDTFNFNVKQICIKRLISGLPVQLFGSLSGQLVVGS